METVKFGSNMSFYSIQFGQKMGVFTFTKNGRLHSILEPNRTLEKTLSCENLHTDSEFPQLSIGNIKIGGHLSDFSRKITIFINFPGFLRFFHSRFSTVSTEIFKYFLLINLEDLNTFSTVPNLLKYLEKCRSRL